MEAVDEFLGIGWMQPTKEPLQALKKGAYRRHLNFKGLRLVAGLFPTAVLRGDGIGWEPCLAQPEDPSGDGEELNANSKLTRGALIHSPSGDTSSPEKERDKPT